MKKQYTTPVIRSVQVKNEPILGAMSPEVIPEGTTPEVPLEEMPDVNNNPDPTNPDYGLNG